MEFLKKNDTCYRYGNERDFSDLIMFGKFAFWGTLGVGAIVTGSIMLAVADNRLGEYKQYLKGYYNDSSVMEFMEENVDEEQLYSLDNQENVVLSKNEWDRLKE